MTSDLPANKGPAPEESLEDRLFQNLSCPELWLCRCGNLDFLLRLRVDTHASRPLHGAERSEAADRDLFAATKRLHDRVEQRINRERRLLLRLDLRRFHNGFHEDR